MNVLELIHKLKGIHPGLIVGRELKKRGLRKVQFANEIGEHAQTLASVANAKRRMNTPLSLKIEKALGWEEGLLMTLQVYYDIRQIRMKAEQLPDISVFRPALFWDTSLAKINWKDQKEAVIRRVYERGNAQEQSEIERFYGTQVVQEVMEKYGK